MAILVLGANGFIGRNTVSALERAGFEVVRGTQPAMDLARDVDASVWRARLGGIDTVVNAVGIFRETGEQTFERIHLLGPRALFVACAAAGVRVIQVSALGADDEAQSRFHRTKKQADDELLSLAVPSVVVMPSFVFGPGGESARLFTMLASLPVIPLPAGGTQPIQPVHIDDLCDAVVAIVKDGRFSAGRVPIVGPEPLAFREFLGRLRQSLGLRRPRFAWVPRPLVEFIARLGAGPLDIESWRMLERGNYADAADTRALLGREPRAVEEFVRPGERQPLLLRAKLDWLMRLLRLSLAIVWIAAGVVSMGFYPVSESLWMLSRVGLTGAVALAALYGSALFDIALGLATLFWRGNRRWLWKVQAATIVAYTAILTIFLPEYWLHPFGPVVKNIPILAAILTLHELDE